MLEKLELERVTIPLPFRLDHVHCLIGEGENGFVVMDTGLHNEQTRQIWDDVLKGRYLSDMILTHVHPDHTGYAGTLQTQTNARVQMSEKDAQTMNKIWSKAALPLLQDDYNKFALPTDVTNKITDLTEGFQPFVTPFPTVHTFLQEGDSVQFGKERYEVIETPGHADGLLCFYQKNKQVLLSTDHILPKITPNIAYWFYGEENPLRSYELSLQKIKKLEIAYAIPSHGEPFEHVHKRIDEIWTHHEDRLSEMLTYMKDPMTVYEMCQKVFNKQLSVYDLQFAVGETMAHMEYLRYDEKCDRELVDGHWLYRRK